MRHLSATVIVLACLVAVAPSASALYLATPLVVSADAHNPDVGATVTFTIEPQNESVKAQLAGRTLRIGFEHGDPESGAAQRGTIGNVTLDADAKGTFTWVVTAETKDHNVYVQIHDGDELVGAANIAVEDAPPTLMAAQSGMPEDDVPVQNDMGAEESADSPRSVPAGGFAILGGALAVALVVAQRRK